MDESDKSSSSIVLDIAWSELDTKNEGFIYAKDLPELINKIEQVLNRSKPNSGNNKSWLSTTGKFVIESFAGEKGFFKIYKNEFKQLFHGLIGKSFHDTLNGSIESDEIIKDILTSSDLKSNVAGMKDLLSPKRDTSSHKKYASSPRHNASPRKYSSPRKVKELEEQIYSLEESLRYKDGIITEKDRELVGLTKSLGEYKDKYGYLERQFNFYKVAGETPKKMSNGDVQQGNLGDDNSTQNEFLINELKRRLEEQMVTIVALREEIQASNQPYSLYNGNTKNMNGKNSRNNNYRNEFSMFFLLIILLVPVIVYLNYFNTFNNLDEYGNGGSLSWWENNRILSRLGWYLKDNENNFDIPLSPSTEAYDRIFGIQN